MCRSHRFAAGAGFLVSVAACSFTPTRAESPDALGDEPLTLGGDKAEGGFPGPGTSGVAGVPVNLRSAASYAVLTKAGISGTTATVVGDLGVSPAAATYITGFSLIADASNTYSTSAQVTGRVYAASYVTPTPGSLTTAIGDMELATSEATARAPDVRELGGGNIGGMTLGAGVYAWTTGLHMGQDVTLTGSATDVWIFQVAQDVTMSASVRVVLGGGARAKNVFWQVTGGPTTLAAMAHLEGVVLANTSVTLAAGASVHGRLFAQTSVDLDGSTLTQPMP